jgi:hypothetical protein
MSNLQKTTRLFAFLALYAVLACVILVGCTTPTVVVEPTPDIPKIRTESVQTVVANLTIEAALNPTATTPATAAPIVVTATAAPSEAPTQAPAASEATATLIPTLTPVATLKPATGGGNPAPTATRRAGPDQAQYVSQSPYDGQVYHPSNQFDANWTFKNVGTSTWTKGIYYIRFAGKGTNLAKADKYMVSKDVLPGDSYTFIADMVAPAQGGRYVSYWQLVNNNGAVFYEFYLVIDVK